MVLLLLVRLSVLLYFKFHYSAYNRIVVSSLIVCSCAGRRSAHSLFLSLSLCRLSSCHISTLLGTQQQSRQNGGYRFTKGARVLRADRGGSSGVMGENAFFPTLEPSKSIPPLSSSMFAFTRLQVDPTLRSSTLYIGTLRPISITSYFPT